MADFPNDVGESIKHIESLIKQLLDVTTGSRKSTSSASSPSSVPSGIATPAQIEKSKRRLLVLEQELEASGQNIHELSEALNEELEKTAEHLTFSEAKDREKQLTLERVLEHFKNQLTVQKDIYRQKLESMELTQEEVMAEQAKLSTLEQRIVAQARLVDQEKNSKQQVDLLRKSTSDLMQKMTGLSLTWEEMASVKFAKNFRSAWAGASGLGGALKTVGRGILDVIGPSSLLGNGWALLADTWKKAIFQADELRAKFQQATGTTGEYSTEVFELRKEYSEYVLNIEDSFKAYESLMTKLTGFRDLTKDTRMEIAGHTAMMDKMGVSYDVTSGFIDHATLALNMTHDQAMEAQGQFVKLADGMKATASELIEGFNKASGSMTVYGKNAHKVFANVAKFADAAGVSVDALLKMTQQFDSFEDAAGQVGKLNAMLGGSYLSTVDMLNASDDVRIRKIKEGMELSGQQFDQMGKYQKLYITQTLGLKSVDEAANLLGGSLAGLDAKLAENNLTQKEAAERAKAFSDIGQKLEAVLQNIVTALEPIIDLLHILIEAVADVVSWAKENALAFWAIVGVAIVLFRVLRPLVSSMLGLGKAVESIDEPIKKAGKSAGGAATGMLGFAGAAIGVGVAIFIVAAGVALVVSALALLVYVAGNAAKGSMLELSAMIGVFTASLVILGLAWPLAIYGLIALASGFVVLAAGLYLISTEDVNALADVFGSLSAVFNSFDMQVFDAIIDGMIRVAKAADDIDHDVMVSIGYAFQQIGSAMDVAIGSSGAQIIGGMVTNMDAASTSVREARNSVQPAQNGRMATMINQSGTSQASSKNNSSQRMPEIVVKIGERELFRLMDNYMEDRASVSRT